ncbi:D-threonate kinase [Orbus sasakiae]|uniref:D-threonate kinase n=1 Tax=Orbus sasakiae TaxID=1078475 RepID=A0ABP9N3U2_9GAMM
MLNNDYSKLLIIADDFTGANDSGVQLTKKGAYVDVYFDWQTDYSTSCSDVIVVNTDTRALTPEDAKIRITQLIKANSQPRPIYKKIDSTLRGNIGSEIETLLMLTEYQIALIIPAFPDMNRTVINGICYVNNTELLQTEFATDPKTPICSSSVKECLITQTTCTVLEIGLQSIRAHTLVNQITQAANNGVKFFIIDAQTNEDLSLIMQQIRHLNFRSLLVGSAGLINYLPAHYLKNHVPYCLPDKDQHMLVIAGSMSHVTQQQIAHAIEHNEQWQVIDLLLEDIFPHFNNDKISQYCQRITDIFSKHKNAIIRTSKNTEERHHITYYCQKYQLTRKELGEYICQCLGRIVQNINAKNLFLTGGDVAIAIAKSLGAIGFHIEGEVMSGIPYGCLLGKTQKNYRIFTKAGGFGEIDIFTRSLELI